MCFARRVHRAEPGLAEIVISNETPLQRGKSEYKVPEGTKKRLPLGHRTAEIPAMQYGVCKGRGTRKLPQGRLSRLSSLEVVPRVVLVVFGLE